MSPSGPPGQRRGLWGVIAVCALAACAAAPPPEGGTPTEQVTLEGWRRAETAGLTFYTDAPDATALASLQQIGRFVDFVSRLVYGHPFRADRPNDVFLFARRSEYRRFAPEKVRGHARRGDGENVVALSIEGIYAGTETLYHELVHLVLYAEPGRHFPSWFHEGLAVLLSQSVVRGDVLTAGDLPPMSVATLERAEPIPLRNLLSRPAYAQRDPTRYYADAWAFVHFGLMATSIGGADRHEAFTAFVSRLSLGAAWEEAFVEAFGTTPEALDQAFADHRHRLTRTRVVRLANFPLDDSPSIAFEPVAPLDAARRLGRLGLDGFDVGAGTAAQLFDRVLAQDPRDPEALCGRIRIAASREDLELGRELWQRLGDADRRNPAAWQAEADLALAIDRYRRVLEAWPDRLAAQAGLGRAAVLATHEDPAPAIAALERALGRWPDHPTIRLDLAELLIRSGRRAEALAHLDYVLEAYRGTEYAVRARLLRWRRR